jgi:tetratricopeptide (TPR) repeat protein
VNLGNAHARNGDNSGALARYQTAAGLLPAKVPYDLQSSLLLNWGQTLIEMGEWNEARNILEKLRSIVRDNDERCHRILQLLPALSGGNR